MGTQRGDVYSYAVIIQEIMLRTEPYGDNNMDPEGKVCGARPLSFKYLACLMLGIMFLEMSRQTISYHACTVTTLKMYVDIIITYELFYQETLPKP